MFQGLGGLLRGLSWRSHQTLIIKLKLLLFGKASSSNVRHSTVNRILGQKPTWFLYRTIKNYFAHSKGIFINSVQVFSWSVACLISLCSLLNWYIRSIALCNNDIYQYYDTLCHKSRNCSPNCHQHSDQEKSSIQQTTFSSQSNLRWDRSNNTEQECRKWSEKRHHCAKLRYEDRSSNSH